LLNVFIVLSACWSCKGPISHLLKIIAPPISTQAEVQVDERCNSPITYIGPAIGVMPAES
jgi:hypothetical protein